MSALAPIIDLYCDESLLDYLVQSLDAHQRSIRKLPSMAQVQGLYRRAMGVRQADDLFLNQKGQLNTESFEAWLKHRSLLAERRGNAADQAFFDLVVRLLFGQDTHCLRRASNARLAEWKSTPPSPSERGEVQYLLFRRWIACFCGRARYLINQQPRHSGRS